MKIAIVASPLAHTHTHTVSHTSSAGVHRYRYETYQDERPGERAFQRDRNSNNTRGYLIRLHVFLGTVTTTFIITTVYGRCFSCVLPSRSSNCGAEVGKDKKETSGKIDLH